MIRCAWTVNMRNRLSSLAMDCDSGTAIEEAKMTLAEREELRKKLMQIVEWIDKKIPVKKG